MIKYFRHIFILISVMNIISFSQNWFPAEVGNKTLEKCTIYEQMWGNVRNFFLISIEKDTVIYDHKYFLVRNSNYLKNTVYEERWFRYDPESQKIFWRVMDTSVVYMDFNIPDGGEFTQYNPANGTSINRTVFESTINLFGNTYSLKGFIEFELSLYMRKWIDGFGIKPLGINNPRIEQVLQYSNNDTTYLEYGFSPYFDSFSPVLVSDNFSFNFDFWVDHFYTQSNGSVWVDFIDSVYFDFYYKSISDSIPGGRWHSYKVFQLYTPFRRVYFNIDSTLINSGYSFYYKVIAKDKGLIPKYAVCPDTGYYEIVFTTTGISSEDSQLGHFFLLQNYPNPFNPSTKISWQSPVGSWQTLKVYDVLGREVATLVDEYKEAGYHEVEFNSAGLASGVYYYRLKAGEFVQTMKMIYIK